MTSLLYLYEFSMFLVFLPDMRGWRRVGWLDGTATAGAAIFLPLLATLLLGKTIEPRRTGFWRSHLVLLTLGATRVQPNRIAR